MCHVVLTRIFAIDLRLSSCMKPEAIAQVTFNLVLCSSTHERDSNGTPQRKSFIDHVLHHYGLVASYWREHKVSTGSSDA